MTIERLEFSFQNKKKLVAKEIHTTYRNIGSDRWQNFHKMFELNEPIIFRIFWIDNSEKEEYLYIKPMISIIKVAIKDIEESQVIEDGFESLKDFHKFIMDTYGVKKRGLKNYEVFMVRF